MTLDQVKNYAEHSGNPIIRDLCEMVLTLDASNARAHECAEREKARAEKAEAAAPQLLKALEEVLRLNGGWASLQVGFPQSAYSSERERTDCVSKARAAIAKAKGETK